MAGFPYYEREPTEMSDAETIQDLMIRIDALEKEIRSLHRQDQMLIDHHKHLDGMVFGHEASIFKLESRIKRLELLLQDDHK